MPGERGHTTGPRDTSGSYLEQWESVRGALVAEDVPAMPTVVLSCVAAGSVPSPESGDKARSVCTFCTKYPWCAATHRALQCSQLSTILSDSHCDLEIATAAIAALLLVTTNTASLLATPQPRARVTASESAARVSQHASSKKDRRFRFAARPLLPAVENQPQPEQDKRYLLGRYRWHRRGSACTIDW